MTLLNVREAAERLRVSERLLFKLWRADQGPPRLRVGNRVLLEASALENWLASRREQSGAQAAAA